MSASVSQFSDTSLPIRVFIDDGGGNNAIEEQAAQQVKPAIDANSEAIFGSTKIMTFSNGIPTMTVDVEFHFFVVSRPVDYITGCIKQKNFSVTMNVDGRWMTAPVRVIKVSADSDSKMGEVKASVTLSGAAPTLTAIGIV